MPESERNKILNDLKLVLDITSRVDERLKIIAEIQQDMSKRLNHYVNEHNTLLTRVTLLESHTEDIENMEEKLDSTLMNELSSHKDFTHRIERLEAASGYVSSKFKHYAGLVVQAVWVVVVCYILYKLGLPANIP